MSCGILQNTPRMKVYRAFRKTEKKSILCWTNQESRESRNISVVQWWPGGNLWFSVLPKDTSTVDSRSQDLTDDPLVRGCPVSCNWATALSHSTPLRGCQHKYHLTMAISGGAGLVLIPRQFWILTCLRSLMPLLFSSLMPKSQTTDGHFCFSWGVPERSCLGEIRAHLKSIMSHKHVSRCASAGRLIKIEIIENVT